MLRYTWRVGSLTEKRAWLSANYACWGWYPCAQIVCEEEYTPYTEPTGELTLMLADHSATDGFRWRKVKAQFVIVEDAKIAVDIILERHPEFIPAPGKKPPERK